MSFRGGTKTLFFVYRLVWVLVPFSSFLLSYRAAGAAE